VFTAKTVATINIPNVTAMVRIMFLIGLSPFGRHGFSGFVQIRPELSCCRRAGKLASPAASAIEGISRCGEDLVKA